jgi:hypothetical protein
MGREACLEKPSDKPRLYIPDGPAFAEAITRAQWEEIVSASEGDPTVREKSSIFQTSVADDTIGHYQPHLLPSAFGDEDSDYEFCVAQIIPRSSAKQSTDDAPGKANLDGWEMLEEPRFGDKVFTVSITIRFARTLGGSLRAVVFCFTDLYDARRSRFVVLSIYLFLVAHLS